MTDLLTSNLQDARRMHVAAAAGNAEAIAWFRALFAATARCFLCDGVVGENRQTAVIPNPKLPTSSALLAPVCGSCCQLPEQKRREQELRMLRHMFPAVKWRPAKDKDPSYLRGKQ